eukprot:4683611-Pyramimonas_sp.AAC.1
MICHVDHDERIGHPQITVGTLAEAIRHDQRTRANHNIQYQYEEHGHGNRLEILATIATYRNVH